ncbi:MAG: hypothetical protein ACRDF6_04830 [bacterium]
MTPPLVPGAGALESVQLESPPPRLPQAADSNTVNAGVASWMSNADSGSGR